jgi:MtN3 and saliva related transmembrane protein
MIDFYEVCGYAAGVLFASGFIPQIYKSYKTKTMDDISYAWQFIFMIGVILGIIYSVHHNLPPIYLCSSVELVFMIILIIMKIYYSYKKNKNKVIDNLDDIADINSPRPLERPPGNGWNSVP